MSKSPINPNFALAGGIMVISLFLSRVLGIFREMVIAWKFGQSPYTDAYVLSFQIPDLLFFMIAGGALSSAFIPIFSEYLHTGKEKEAWHIYSSVVTFMSIVVMVFIVLAWIYAYPLARMIAPGEDESMYPLIVEMSRIVLPAQFAFFIGGIMFGTLYARQVFAVPGLGPNIYNIGIIFGGLFLAGFFLEGVQGLSWGALIGAFIGNLLIPLLVMRRMQSEYRFVIDLKHPGVRKVFRLMAPVVLGLSLPGVFALILQAFSTYYADGVNTAMNVANRLMQAPLGVFGQALALAAFPALAQFFAQGKMKMFRDQLAKTVRTVLVLTIPVSVLFVVMPNELVRVAFEYRSFGIEDTERTALILRMFGFGIAAWSLSPVLMRGFFAVQRSVTPIVIGTLTTALFVAMSLWVVQTGRPYEMLALAGSISAIVMAIVMLLAVRRVTDGLDLVGILNTAARSLFASLVAAVVPLLIVYVAPDVLSSAGELGLLFVVGVGTIVFGWVYYWVAKRIGLDEVGYVERALERRRHAKEEGVADGSGSSDAGADSGDDTGSEPGADVPEDGSEEDGGQDQDPNQDKDR